MSKRKEVGKSLSIDLMYKVTVRILIMIIIQLLKDLLMSSIIQTMLSMQPRLMRMLVNLQWVISNHLMRKIKEARLNNFKTTKCL